MKYSSTSERVATDASGRFDTDRTDTPCWKSLREGALGVRLELIGVLDIDAKSVQPVGVSHSHPAFGDSTNVE